MTSFAVDINFLLLGMVHHHIDLTQEYIVVFLSTIIFHLGGGANITKTQIYH